MTDADILSLQAFSVFAKAATAPGQRLASNAVANRLLKDISCSVAAGEIMAVIGPNGAGKSSLLSGIAGDLQIDGQLGLQAIEAGGPARARQLAVLPQSNILDFPFRVAEVVALARIPHRTGVELDSRIVAQALEIMDISYLENRLYTELSGGEKQRVHLARVFAQLWRAEDADGSRLLLLDEPTATLDLGHQQAFMQALRKFAAQGVAVVMVVHDVNLAARYADTVLALVCGRQLGFGSVAEVVTADTLKHLFQLEVSILRHPQSGTPMVVDL